MEKKKLSLEKEVIETLSSEELEQVQGGDNVVQGGNNVSVQIWCKDKDEHQKTTSGWCCRKD